MLEEDFVSWALDPARTREERYSIERLIEETIGRWRLRQGIEYDTNYEAERLRKKERGLNPAYEPGYSEQDVRRIAEVLPEVDSLTFSSYDDRPLRDLTVLRFCPAVHTLLPSGNEISDLSPILYLRELRVLHLRDRAVVDLRPVGRSATLEDLLVRIDCPWPDLTGWENLTALRKFEYEGNILALRDVPAFPVVRHAKIHQPRGSNLPLRTLAELPAMPELRRLFLENTWKLDGAERFPHLLNLTIYGGLGDLAPLAALTELTHLFISGDRFDSLAPLAALENLRLLTVRRELPQDYTPLATLPRLHEVRVELCRSSQLELDSLHAILSPWTDDFAVTPPRPLRPLRLFLRADDDDRQGDSAPAAAPRAWGDDGEMPKSEAVWFVREVNQRLGALLAPGWGRIPERLVNRPGDAIVRISRPEDVDQVPKIVDAIRGVIASARHPWSVLLAIEPAEHYERTIDEIAAAAGDESERGFNAEQEREHYEYRQARRREREAFLERLHRYRLRQEQGLPVDPAEFAPPPDELDEEEKVLAGGSAEDPAPENEYDLGTDLSVYGDVTESGFYIHEHYRAAAEFLLDMKAEEPPPADSSQANQ